MNIRPKVVALVAGMFGALIVLEVTIQERGIMPSFASLERAEARTSMTRVDFALERTLEGLESTAADWADWGELYQFMQDRNPGFLATYTTPVAMAPLKVNLLLLVDRDGATVYSAARELGTGKPLPIDLAGRASLPENFPWRKDLTTGRSLRGLVRTDHGVMMMAAAPILDGSGKGQSRGLAILGRLLTPTQLIDLGTQAQAQVAMPPMPASAPTPVLSEAGTMTQVFHSYDDIEGRPVMTLRVDVPRTLIAEAHAAVAYSLWYLVGAAVAVSIFLIILLNRLVVNPIARVTRHAVAMGAGDDLTARLDFAGSDEIGRLAGEFDRMVLHLAEARRQLVDQAFNAGYAELAKGIMRKLEGAMTPLGARLTLLRGRLETAPTREVGAAAAELAEDSAQPPRRDTLTRFVQSGCAQLGSTIEQARGDVAAMAQQASIVTATLAEQRASADNDHVLEPVRLTDLLAQALDIVPDACRRRLIIETDDSWAAIGVVTVARTVLRLVLQNLIINAADAVGEAGLTRGTVRLTAVIVAPEGRPALHIRCSDNGIGMTPEHLRRLFEKDFTTKPRGTAEGIGLHWCANALRSLGGRLTAASEGIGRGATLEVLIPVTPGARPG